MTDTHPVNPANEHLLQLSAEDTAHRVAEVEEFLVTLGELKLKLQRKKEEAHKVIRSKMKDLHHLIDKWESRYLDTATETIDEKIENITKQGEKLSTLVEFIKEDTIREARRNPEERQKELELERQREAAKLLRRQARLRSSSSGVPNKNIHSHSSSSTADAPNNQPDLHTSGSITHDHGGSPPDVDVAVDVDDDDDDDDEEDDDRPEEERKKLLHKFATLKTPLQPEGASHAETTSDLWAEFGNLLDESRKSLKRSLLFVGGIVRGYMRRGVKKDEWVKILRRLESRFEGPERPDNYAIVTPAVVAPQAPGSRSGSREMQKWIRSDSADYNIVWKAVSDIYKYRDNLSFRDALCKQLVYLHDKHPVQLEFYLPQLLTVWLSLKDFEALGHFLLLKCSQAPHFAIQAYFWVCSMGQAGPPKWQKRCFKVLKKIIKAVPYEDGRPGVVPMIGQHDSHPHAPTPASSPADPSHFEAIMGGGGSVTGDSGHGQTGDHPGISPTHRLAVMNAAHAHNSVALGGGSSPIAIATPTTMSTTSAPITIGAGPSPAQMVPIASTSDASSSHLAGPQPLASATVQIHVENASSSRERELKRKSSTRRPKPDVKEAPETPEAELARLTRIEPPAPIPKVDKDIHVPPGKEYFMSQIDFMRRLIDVSRKLGEIYGQKERYKPKLDEELAELESYVKSGNAYLPHLHGSRLRVLRFIKDESNPIPTYGRVLYKLVFEAVDLPLQYTKKMADEYLKLSADIAVMDDKTSSISQTSADGHGIKDGSVFGEAWREVRKRIKSKSTFGSLPHWESKAFIIKHGDFVLQEQFVMQLIIQFQKVWETEGLPLRLVTYRIMAISYQSGLIEVVPNSVSLDKLKTFFEVKGEHSLLDFFNNEWPDPKDFERSRTNFVSSLAAYSIICYLLQIKDRHNGNIMLDSEGVLFHIDFGYLLARTIKFEKAPFKLTEEFIEVMGGDQSKAFKDYCTLCVQGFVAVRKHYEKILLLVEMTISDSAAIPCLERDSITKNLRKRFHLEWNEAQCEEYIMNLLLEARENWRTQVYDSYQRVINNIH